MGSIWLWQVTQAGLLRWLARKVWASVAVMVASVGGLKPPGGGGGGAHISASSVNRPRDTGDVRLPRDVAPSSAPMPHRPPRCGLDSVTRVRSVELPTAGTP